MSKTERLLSPIQRWAFIGLALATPAIASDVAINAKDVIGSYSYLTGDVGYEAFELSADGSFHSWLHERPEAQGTWSLAGNIVTVQEQGGALQVITVQSLTSSKMIVHYNGQKNDAHYLRHPLAEMTFN